MEFDKNKILTVVTADQAKVGMNGWFGNNMLELEDKVKNVPSSKLTTLCYGFMKAFEKDEGLVYYLFYPAPEHFYTDCQAQWVKENNVKVGTKVRVTRTFTEDEDGCCCWAHDDLVGKTGIIGDIGPINLGVNMDDRKFRVVPYFALEVIKEPTYRPFNNNELNDLVGEVLTNKQSGRRKLVTGKPTASEGVNLDKNYITAKDLLYSFYRNGNEPCGIKEEV